MKEDTLGWTFQLFMSGNGSHFMLSGLCITVQEQISLAKSTTTHSYDTML
jgi:hypothetical protein